MTTQAKIGYLAKIKDRYRHAGYEGKTPKPAGTGYKGASTTSLPTLLSVFSRNGIVQG